MGKYQFRIAAKTAAPVARVLYQRKALGLPYGGKVIQRIFGYPEARVRATIALYQMDKQTMELRISQIECDPAMQMRAVDAIPQEWIDEYAEILKSGDKLHPVTVFHDSGRYYLADGFIRVAAHKQAGLTMIDAVIETGDKRACLLYALSANSAHGNKRTSADKRKAVLTMLNDPEWHRFSNSEIAKRCRVDEGMVRKYRPESIFGNSEDGSTVVVRNGKQYSQRTANIGRTKKASSEPNPAAKPQPSLTDTVVAEASVAIPTAKPVRIPDSIHNDGFIVKCKAYENLSEPCLERLKNEVTLYRDIQSQFTSLYKAASAAMRQYASRSSTLGPLAERLMSLLAAAQPDEWEACDNCRDEIGMSTGQDAFGPCSRCRGFGYRIKAN